MILLAVTLVGGTWMGIAPQKVSAVPATQEPEPAPEIDLQRPKQLWQRGRYAEALEIYDGWIGVQSLPDPEAEAVADEDLEEIEGADEPSPLDLSVDQQVAIALGRADCLVSLGRIDEAIDALLAETVLHPQRPELWAALGARALERGRWDLAETAAGQAVELDRESLRGLWTLVQLDMVRGRTETLTDDLRWFVDYRNAHVDTVDDDAEALLIIGQALEQYYRREATGRELAEGLNDVINLLYERAIRVDSLCWHAAYLQARLFLTGHNEADAEPEIQRALQINPRAAEALALLGRIDLNGYKLEAGRKKARRALQINPELTDAHILLADLEISDEEFAAALEAAREAVRTNPRSGEALARLAAAYRLRVEPLKALAVEGLARADNPRPAAFYSALGERLADRRKYPEAERAFLLAAEADPNRADNRIGLGMLYMQIGREAEANALFQAAFDADPFNIRANNMIEVLEHLADYEAVDSEHYRVLIHPDQDRLLGKYMSQYLEKVHGELTERFAFEPLGRTQIEILKDHQWFSGRTVALPFIPTVGACTGKVVALASPRATRKPFNWARVLKHEVVHVITLQQTNFNIPHWYTEALAVDSEGYPRPQAWNTLLLDRVPRRDLLDLETINLGFIRPKEPDERQLAYCQAQLYAQYMVGRFGETALAEMLEAYRLGLTTPEAVEHCFEVPVEDFEADYLKFLDEVVSKIRTREENQEPTPYSQLQRLLAAKPDDPDLNAQMAFENLARRAYREARPFADKALELQPAHPLASYVKARLFELIGDEESALKVLEPALDLDRPNPRVVDLLAKLLLKRNRLREAEALYELARRDDPYNSKWIAGLARIHLRQEDQAAFLGDLTLLAANDADDLDVRKALAERHLERGEFAEAERWARECLYIQVYDASTHYVLGDALAAQGAHEEAVDEYRVTLELGGRGLDVRGIQLKLARSLVALDRADEAEPLIDTILRADPENQEARELRERLNALD